MTELKQDKSYAGDRDVILALAREAIEQKVRFGKTCQADPEKLPASLTKDRACFVTLRENGQLRGCIGSLEASQPLYLDIIENAISAATRDPRFPPVSTEEINKLEIHVSILSPREPMQFKDEQDLLEQLRPGVDGIVIRDGWYKATFLPSVWESLPEKSDFLNQLKLKAGLAQNHWSDTMSVERYTAESIE
jgi:AmmeMemoRadiSam system protein A